MTDFYSASGQADAWGYIETVSEGEDWTPEAGWQITKVWQGPRRNRDAFITGKGLGSPASLSCRYDGDVCTISVRYNTTTNAADQDITGLTQKDPYFVGWTLSGNSIQSEIAASAYGFGADQYVNDADDSTLGPQLHSQILGAIRSWKYDVDRANSAQTYPLREDGTEFDVYDYACRIVDDGNAHRQARARYLFLKKLNNIDTYEFNQPVLRKVMTLRSTSEVKVGVEYIGRLFTWEALKVHEPTLDSAIIVGITTLDAASTQYSYKWRKRMPTIEVSSDGKRIITQEYWAYELFEPLLYGPAITNNGGSLVPGTWPNFGASDPFFAYNSICTALP